MSRALIALLSLLMSSVSAYAAEKHVHGVATLQVAIDRDRLVLDFSSPLDNLIGFEHAPRTEGERATVRRMARRLHKAEALFVPAADARCTQTAVRIASPPLDPALLGAEAPAEPKRPASSRKPAKPPPKAGPHEHASLSAEIVFRCERPSKLSGLEVKLFDAFSRLKRVDARVAGAKKPVAAKLSSGHRRVSW